MNRDIVHSQESAVTISLLISRDHFPAGQARTDLLVSNFEKVMNILAGDECAHASVLSAAVAEFRQGSLFLDTTLTCGDGAGNSEAPSE